MQKRSKFRSHSYALQPFVTMLLTAFVSLATLLRVSALEAGDIKTHLDLTYNETVHALQKRGYHEEAPLIYVADDHPLEYYWTRPEYPSRMLPIHSL